MNEPLISVIVPIYKVEKYLRKCVDSILAQTYTHLEIILVNDGSPDNCGVICDEYAAKDSRIIVIHKENGGLSDARNAGLDIAKGEYIGFVDSDDYITEDMYEKLYAAISKSEADLAICEYYKVDEDGNQYAPYKVVSLNNKIITKQEAFYALCDRNNPFIVSSFNKLYKFSLLNSIVSPIRFPLGKLYEDTFVINDILDNCKSIVTISDKLYYYVSRSGSIMTGTHSLKLLDYYYVMLERINFFKSKGEKSLAKKSYHFVYRAMKHILINLDLSIPENKKAVRPLYWKVFFHLLFTFNYRIIKLIIAPHKRLREFAVKLLRTDMDHF